MCISRVDRFFWQIEKILFSLCRVTIVTHFWLLIMSNLPDCHLLNKEITLSLTLPRVWVTTAIHGFYNAKKNTTKASRKKVYKSRLSYKSQWESTHPCMNYNVAQLLRSVQERREKQEIDSATCLLISKTQYSTHSNTLQTTVIWLNCRLQMVTNSFSSI